MRKNTWYLKRINFFFYIYIYINGLKWKNLRFNVIFQFSLPSPWPNFSCSTTSNHHDHYRLSQRFRATCPSARSVLLRNIRYYVLPFRSDPRSQSMFIDERLILQQKTGAKRPYPQCSSWKDLVLKWTQRRWRRKCGRMSSHHYGTFLFTSLCSEPVSTNTWHWQRSAHFYHRPFHWWMCMLLSHCIHQPDINGYLHEKDK